MDLINGKALTFLRRALSEDLAPINQVEVALSMGDSFVATGLTIEDDLLSRAAKATKGYAYLVLILAHGQKVFDIVESKSRNRGLVNNIVKTSLCQRNAFGDVALAHNGTFGTMQVGALPNGVTDHKQQSKSSEIAKRMGKKTNEVSSIRAKLLQREVIQAPQRGYVQFAVPDLDIYLRENAAEILERF